MGRPALAAILALSGPAAALLLSPSVATERGHDAAVVTQGEPTQVPDGAAARMEMSHPSRIPLQLVLTAKKGTGVVDLPRKQRANVLRTLAMNPEMTVRWLNDTACQEFIDRHFGDELGNRFKHESVGYFRGDICRAAVIAIEGGFYADLDVQLRVPFSEMVDHATTFMSAFDSFCNMWNAVFAAEPNSDVMHAVIESMMSWYNGSHPGELMGTKTFYDGMNKVVKRDCLKMPAGSGTNAVAQMRCNARRKLQFQCGHNNAYRLYREMALDCGSNTKARNPEECPDTRAHGFWGLRFGIYEPGKDGKLVGWSRYEDCTNFGCNERRSALRPNGTGGGEITEHTVGPDHRPSYPPGQTGCP